MSEWIDSAGHPITLGEIINACYIACSVISKELEFNEKIKTNAQQKATYERSLEIQMIIRGRFEKARDDLIRKRQPQKIIPFRLRRIK